MLYYIMLQIQIEKHKACAHTHTYREREVGRNREEGETCVHMNLLSFTQTLRSLPSIKCTIAPF